MKCAALLLVLVACKAAPPPPPRLPAPTIVCADAAPCALASGVAQTGTIAAVGQVDVYSIPVPATGKRTLLQLALSNAAPVSPVRLVFVLETSDGASVLASRGSQTATGPQSIQGVYLLPAAGTYRLIVRDSLNTHADARNGYSLIASLLTDPDAQEPDDLPAQARPLAFSSTLAQTTGVIASIGDRDLCAFQVPAPGSLVRWVVSQPASSAMLRLRARLLDRSATNASELAVAEVDAALPGGPLAADVVRYLPGGSYLIGLDDLSGQEADPRSQWTAGVQAMTDPDPSEQSSRNDTAQTATQLLPGSALQGAIGSQGDVDWFQVQLPATASAQLLEVRLDPGAINQDLELTWAVGAVASTPTGPCDQRCGPSAFCQAGACAYAAHANHHFLPGESSAQVVRVRHLGAAEVVRVVIEDFGDRRWSNNLYTLSARILADPDANENSSFNDSRDAGTQLVVKSAADGGLAFSASGQIASWDAMDGLTTAETAGDVDWFHLPLPPRLLAPTCPQADAGVADAGLCTPDPSDGGPVYLPRPDYGVALHWHDPSDGVYQLGLQGTIPVAQGTACLFSLDRTLAHAEDGGGHGYGDRPGDLCFCVPSASADQLWVRLEAAHRPTLPAVNQYSDQPYSFELALNPGGLQAACDGGCAGPSHPSSCPGNQ